MKSHPQLTDASFAVDSVGLHHAVSLLADAPLGIDVVLPDALPEHGLGEGPALERLAPLVLGRAVRLGDANAFAHMDPPTPWITWATTLWNAALNQNLLHPDTGSAAAEVECRVIAWLAPWFGMDGGHMTPGSTVSNLTALWAARELAGVRTVAASGAAHLSVRKAAHLLGLAYRELPAGREGALLTPPDAALDQHTALVLTAGHTSTGAIDSLALAGTAAWTHVDAAWAGPLRLSKTHGALLDGIERADSVAISAHKWLFQPKEAGLILFRDNARAEPAISMSGAYLTRPNVGLLGSRAAAAVPLLATLLAFGRDGLAARLDRCMAAADALAIWIAERRDCELLASPITGVVNWRPCRIDPEELHGRLPAGSASLTTIGGERWLRNVAANPDLDLAQFLASVAAALAK